MFEAQVAFYLNKYLGRYLHGLDAESLKISVWKGDVELRNLHLKPEALADLELPIKVKAGLLGRLTLKVPWAKLGKEPVVVEFDRLYVLACPHNDEGTGGKAEDPEEYEASADRSEHESKMRKVRAAEAEWMQELEAKLASSKDGGKSGEKSSFVSFQSLIDPILGNLQLRLTNLHIRYEDDVSYPGYPMSLGIMLRKVAAHTTDEAGVKAFVTGNVLQLLRKAVQLQKLAIYFDVGPAFLKPNKQWSQLAPADWDALFMPAVHTDTYSHHYLICPVSCDMQYMRRSRKFRRTENDAKQEAVLTIEELSIQYSRAQYAGSQCILQMLDAYQANAPYRFMRPTCRPQKGPRAVIWWRYAFRSVCQQQRRQRLSWEDVKRYCLLRKRYVPLYTRCLQGKQPGGEEAVAAMDKQLSEGTILLFRRMAHAKAEVAKRRDTSTAAASSHKGGHSGWVGWLRGGKSSGGSTAVDSSGPGTESNADGGGGGGLGMKSELSSEEWAKLEELLSSEQEGTQVESRDTPHTLMMQLQLVISSASLVLADDAGVQVLVVGMDQLAVLLKSYPKTMATSVSIQQAGVRTPLGPLLNTGFLTTPVTSHSGRGLTAMPSFGAGETPLRSGMLPASAGGSTSAAAAGSSGGAFRLDLVRQPQDNTADAVVKLLLAPSYVTYNPAALAGVSEFFKTSQTLELSALQAQAAARAAQLQRMAQLRLKEMSGAAEKPRLLLSLAMHAPKVAIPDKSGKTTLVMDLGLFHLSSSRRLAASLPKEEAALFECFRLGIDAMSAYIVDGPFAWPLPPNKLRGVAAGAGEAPAPASGASFHSAVSSVSSMSTPRGSLRGAGGASSLSRPAGSGAGGSMSKHGNSSAMAASAAAEGGGGDAQGWDLMRLLVAQQAGGHSKLVPLLERFRVDVDLQVATVVHPRLPQLRAAVHASPIKLHFSPFRYHRLMVMLHSVLAPSPPLAQSSSPVTDALMASNLPAAAQPLWLTDAEYRAKVAVLAWEGMAGTTAKWHSRWLTVWRGRLYFSREKDDTEPLTTRSYWRDDRMVDLPPSCLGGTPFVLALAPAHVGREEAAESKEALVLRLKDAATLAELRRHLMRSKTMMSAVAGLLSPDDVSDGSVGVTEDIFGELLKHKDIVEVTGQLEELSVQINGRAPAEWWPPADAAGRLLRSASSARRSAQRPSSRSHGSQAVGKHAGLEGTAEESEGGAEEEEEVEAASDSDEDLLKDVRGRSKHAAAGGAEEDGEDVEVTLAEEQPLILARFRAATVGLSYSADRLAVTASMQALEVDDLLIGAEAGARVSLARSTAEPLGANETTFISKPLSGSRGGVLGTATLDEGDEVFYDVDAEQSSEQLEEVFDASKGSGSASTGSMQGPAGLSTQTGPSAKQRLPQQLVSVAFTSHTLSSSRYEGVDTELAVRLSRLYFTCRRPTVAALMALGLDMSAIGVQLAAASPAADEAAADVAIAVAAEEVDGADRALSSPATSLTALGTGKGTLSGSGSSAALADVVKTGGEQRTIIRLQLEMETLELEMAYEGADSLVTAVSSTTPPILSASAANFSFKLDVHPSTLDLDTSLGDFVATYGSLDPLNPYSTICSLRPGTSGSLIEVAFRIHSREQSMTEGRVPNGLQYYSLQAHLSAVQIVYLNRFLVEFLSYLNVMLAMQPAARVLGPRRAGEPSMTASRSQSAPVPAPAAAVAAPMITLLAVTLDAPVITLPEMSSSGTCLELDLGHLQLSNSVTWQPGGAGKRVLEDSIQVTLTQVSVVVCSGSTRGANLIKEMGSGFKVQLSRPLIVEAAAKVPRSSTPLPLPPMVVAVHIPELTAVILDTDYKRLLAVLTCNFAEPADPPPAAVWVQRRFAVVTAAKAAPMDQQSASISAKNRTSNSNSVNAPSSGSTGTALPLGASPQSMASGPSCSVGRTRSDGGGSGARSRVAAAPIPIERDFTRSVRQVLAALGDTCILKATVSIGKAQLQLWVQQPDGRPPEALTSVGLADLWLAYHSTAAGHMFVSLQLPTVAVADLRPGIPPEQSLVLSTTDVTAGASDAAAAAAGHGYGGGGSSGGAAKYLSRKTSETAALTPSLLVLEYRSISSGKDSSSGVAAAQCVRMRLQRPTLVLDAAFLMAALNFVAPTPVLQGPVPKPFQSREIYLGTSTHTLSADVWLSPEYRLIADAPGVAGFTLDGGGHRLVLPKGVPPSESLPLIVVGTGQTLTLRNIKIVNSASLPAVLSLGAGAHLAAREEDGVRMVTHSKLEDEYSRYLLSDGNLRGAPAGANSSAVLSGAAAAAVGTALALLQVEVVAIGANLHIINPSPQGPAGSGGSMLGSATSSLAYPASTVVRKGSSDAVGGLVGRKGSSSALQALSSAAAGLTHASSSQSLTQEGGVQPASPSSRRGAPASPFRSLAGTGGGSILDGAAADSAAAGGATVATAAVGMPESPAASRVLRRVALLLDVAVTYKAQGAEQSADASVTGLSVKTLTSVFGATGGGVRRAGTGTGTAGPTVLHTTILEPCDVSAQYTEGADRQDVMLDVSGIALKLSPNVLQQLLQLSSTLTAPLLVPPADAPLLRCDKFEWLWGSQRAAGSSGSANNGFVASWMTNGASQAASFVAGGLKTVGRGGVDAMAGERGVTLWRPQVPNGYVIMGDVLTAGSAQPMQQVAILAINSGLVAHPTGFTHVWSGEGVLIWRPVPPPGYVALGCIATLDFEPPSTRLVGCVHEQTAVAAAPSACLLPNAQGNLWVVQNSGCTFQVAPADGHLPQVPLLDLRSPLGVPPAALQPLPTTGASLTPTPSSALVPSGSSPASFASATHQKASSGSLSSSMVGQSNPAASYQALLAAQAPPPSLLAQKQYMEQRARLISAVTSQRSVATCVEFLRLWWDKNSSHPSSSRVSFWRPLPPPGYVALGDCMATGMYAPPQGVLVLRDMTPGELLAEGKPPLLARPMGYAQVWRDDYKERIGEPHYLSLWRPLPPAGYVAVGMAVSLGSYPPSASVLRCVRADMVLPLKLNKLAPNLCYAPYKQRGGLYGWVTHEATATFTVIPQEQAATAASAIASGSQAGGATPGAAKAAAAAESIMTAFSIKLGDEAEDVSSQSAGSTHGSEKPADGANTTGGGGGAASFKTANVEVKVGRTSLLLRNNNSTPILELEANDIKTGIFVEGPGVMRCWAFLTTSIWSYNALLAAWEPIIEPWQVLLHLGSNSHSRTKSGVAPGTRLRLTSTQGNVQVAVASAALTSLLEAMPEWMESGEQKGSMAVRQQLAASEGSTLTALVHNKLGVPCQMLLDWGDHQEIVELTDGEARVVTQPLPYQAPLAHHLNSAAAATLAQPPHIRLLVDVLSCVVTGSLPVSLSPGSQLAVQVKLSGPVAPLMEDSTWGVASRCVHLEEEERVAEWQERFVLKLPTALSEQLLSPAPGDNQFAGVPLQLEAQLMDTSQDGGLGACVGIVSLPVAWDWLANEVSQLVTYAHSTASGAASPLPAEVLAGQTMNVRVVQPSTAGSSGGAGSSGTAFANSGDTAPVSAATPATAAAAGTATLEPVTSAPTSQPTGLRLQLRISVDTSQVDTLWRSYLHRPGGSGSVSSSGAVRGAAAQALGRRALKLPGSEAWAPFNYGTLQMSGAGKASAAGIVPIPAGAGVALESRVAPGGLRHESLRSLCQFVNNTDLLLEVSILVDSEAAAWTLIPSTTASAKPAASAAPAPVWKAAEVAEAEVFEHERWVGLRGWSPQNLLPTDRSRYSRYRNGSSSTSSFPQLPLPPNWEWEGPWELETTGHVDKDGWSYAFNWPGITYPPRPGQGTAKGTDYVRRRRWVRRYRTQGPSTAVVHEDHANRRLLGQVAPGDRLPLPYGWAADSAELQVRPVMPEALLPPGLINEPDVSADTFDEGAGDDALRNTIASTNAGAFHPDFEASQAAVASHPIRMQSFGSGSESQLSSSSNVMGGSNVLGGSALARVREAAAAVAGSAGSMSSSGGGGGALGSVVHGWSQGSVNGTTSVALSHLEDGATRLLCCRPLHGTNVTDAAPPGGARRGVLGPPEREPAAPPVTSMRAALDLLQPCWLSTIVDFDPLAASGAVLDTVVDWRLTARPPLVIENSLPVAGHFRVWERPRLGGPLKLRQQGRVEGGESAAIYTADMRQQVALSFWPDGCEFGESEPVIVSEGFAQSNAGVASQPRLPSSFNCSYSHSTANTQLRVYMSREVDLANPTDASAQEVASAGGPGSSAGTSAGNVDVLAKRVLAPAEAVAQGYPLTVRLYVPLWVVNATAVPMTIGVVPLESASGDDEPEASGPTMLPRLAGGSGLSTPRVLDTEAFTQTAVRPSHYVTVLPYSVELLSYTLADNYPHAVVLAMLGSKWTSPIALPGLTQAALAGAAAPSSAAAAAAAAAVASSPAAASALYNEPIIIRARAKNDGSIHEAVARIDSGGMTHRRSLVLRLDPHLVVSNRTGYQLSLLQPDPTATMVGPMASGVDKRSAAGGSSGYGPLPAGRTSSMAAAAAVATAQPLPSGGIGIPIVWTKLSGSRRLLCLSLPQKGGQGTSPDEFMDEGRPSAAMWSEPFKAEYPGGNDLQIVLPVYCLGDPASNRTDSHGNAVMPSQQARTPQQMQLQQQQAMQQQPQSRPLSAAPANGGGGGFNNGGKPEAKASLAAHQITTSPGTRSDSRVYSYDEAVGLARQLFAGAKQGEATQEDRHDGMAPGPTFIKILRYTELGIQEFLAVVVEVSITVRAPGCLHLQLLSLGGSPAQLLHNATPFPVRYRESSPAAVWCLLPPFSAAGFARQYIKDGGASELELRDDSAQPAVSELVSMESGAMAFGSAVPVGRVGDRNPAAAAKRVMLKLGPQKAEVLAQVVDVLELVMCPAGLMPVTGGSGTSLGATRHDKTLRIAPRPPPLSPSQGGGALGRTSSGGGGRTHVSASAGAALTTELLLAHGLNSSGGSVIGSSFHVSVEVSALELSVIDHRPQELMVLTMDGLSIDYHSGSTAGVSYVQLHARIKNAQLDDQLPGSAHPVMLLPQDSSNRDAAGGAPLLFITYVCEPNKQRGVLHCPCIAWRILPLRLAVHEPIVWRLLALQEVVTGAAASVASSGDAGAVAAHQQVSTDVPLSLDLLNIEDLDLRISFKPDAAVRPRSAGGLLSVGLEFASLEDLHLALPGVEMERARALRSVLLQVVVSRLKERLLSIAFSVLRNYGIFGGTSKFLAVASQGVASLTDAGAGSSGREVKDLGDGIMEGGKAFTKGLMSGAMGLVTKPLEGADRGGFMGFFGGMTQGIVGLAANPISGTLAAASKVTEGLDASSKKVRDTLGGTRRTGRKRLARAFAGDRVLRPFALHPALGQALLYGASYSGGSNLVNAVVGAGRLPMQLVSSAPSSSSRPENFRNDAYEEHFLLPGSRVLLVSNRRLLLLNAPEFMVLQSQVMSGEVTHVTQVPGGNVLWQLPWEQLLTAELTWSPQPQQQQQQPGQRQAAQQSLPPDSIRIHRKLRTSEDDSLFYDVRCRLGSHQAQDILAMVQAVRYRYYTLPRQEASGWRERHLLPSRSPDGQERPDTVLSLDFRLVWQSSSNTMGGGFSNAFGMTAVGGSMGGGFRKEGSVGGLVSVWRPVGPVGYGLLGDVAVAGREPPPRPVRLYKDIVNSDGDSRREGPRLLQPTGFQLVFRDTASSTPVTIWRPIAPKNYIEMGCIAWPSIDEPPLSVVRCLRKDLAIPAALYDHPLWQGTSSDDRSWSCSIWQVDNPCSTFLAHASLGRPPPALARAPMY